MKETFTERHERLSRAAAEQAKKRSDKVLFHVGDRPYEAGRPTAAERQALYAEMRNSPGALREQLLAEQVRLGLSPGVLPRNWLIDVSRREREYRKGGK